MKINIVGSIFGSSGYDSHTRSLANALYKIADCKLSTQLPQDWLKMCNDAELDSITKPERKEDWNLIITLPHMWKLFLGQEKNACYCVWEGDKVPDSWIDEMLNPKVDLIFVPSNHTKEAIMKTAFEINNGVDAPEINAKIRIIPHGCNQKIFYNLNKPKQDNVFRFICNKGFRGVKWDRGGVAYLLEAFSNEFKKGEPVELILKLNQAYINPQIIPQVIQQLNLPEDRALIKIVYDNLSLSQLNELYNSADCFVCATRGDAFNLGGIEAMSCGLPTIQTKFGGQTDYMTDKNSLFIDYLLSESEEKPMYEGIQWATPSITMLQKQMRWAFDNQDKIKEMGKQAEENSKNWTWDKSAEKIIKAL